MGLRGPASGRCPDLLVLRQALPGDALPGDTVCVQPTEVQLVIEVVSHDSETLDRLVKPIEYARAGIPWFCRVDTQGGQPKARLYTLNSLQADTASYSHISTPLDRLLAGDPPRLL